jgi:1-acyl-sn-glycerol-3-phosphate acyltransferase
VLIAHNAGEFWPRHSFLKWPGTITLRIGPVIDPKGKTAEEVTNIAHDWIEGQMKEISDPSRWNR